MHPNHAARRLRQIITYQLVGGLGEEDLSAPLTLSTPRRLSTISTAITALLGTWCATPSGPARTELALPR
jgi:hypothetical protein